MDAEAQLPYTIHIEGLIHQLASHIPATGRWMCLAHHGLIFALNPCFNCIIFSHLPSGKLCICAKNAKESVFLAGWMFCLPLSIPFPV